MAASSGCGASASQYDVFLSFRGSDTRKTFTDCLYRTMIGQGIIAYRDSEELHAGDRIDNLLNAVGDSKICIPVLSRGYALSPWCLRELTHVTELNESTGKPEILPIFFDVTPSDVKLKTKLYVEDLEKHEQRPDGESRERWEAALRKVGKIKGWEVQGKAHGEVIELVVKEVLRKLKVKQRPLDSKFIKEDQQIKAIMELLDVDSGTGVRFIGIYGMGGIGKTTLASCIYNEIYPRFDNQCSFLGNIRELSKRNGLVDLQKQLATDIFDSRFVEKFIDADEGIAIIKRRAGSKKVLIVLDHLDRKEQLKKLVGGPDTFGSGSRIIITTRDQRILNEEEGILAYEVKQMDPGKALELFSLHAFNSVSPPDTLESLSREIVSKTGGLPLALEVIGSYLHHQNEEIWKEMIKRLKNVPHDEVWDKLKISYDELRDVEKEIFLDIACFFIDEEKSWATYFWDACNLYPHSSLKKLTDLCLIKIVRGDTIWMHDQLRDFGRDIVCQECNKNLTGRSRSWNGKEALKVVRSKERKDKVQALNLVGRFLDPISIVDEELEMMPHLKFLKLRAGTFVGDVNNYLLELRWLFWCVPPLDCRMANLDLKNLVVFKLSSNENTENWGGWNILKMANKLKVLSLIRCGGLKRTPDFSGCVSLERLSLDSCPNLQEVDSSIGKLKGLTHLDIIWCKSLLSLHEEIGGLANLKQFCMKDCDQMEKLPYSIGKLASLSKLDLSSSKIINLPNSIGNAKHLSFLDLSGMPIVELSISIGELMQLKFLSLHGCRSLRKLPESIGNLRSLQKLALSGTNIVQLPNSIGNAKHLSLLDLSGTPIVELPISIGELTQLEFFSLHGCGSLRKLPESIGNLRSLQKLKLSGTNIVELPNSIGNAKHLSLLDLSSTPIVELPISIGELMQLEFLSLHGCGSLRKLPESIGNLISLQNLKLSGTNIVELPNSIGNAKHLSLLDLLGTPIVELPISIGELMQLKFLSLHGCGSLRKLPESIGNLKSLQKLKLSGTNIVELPNSIGNAKNLSLLDLSGTPIVELPISIRELTQLEFLSLHGCRSLRKLPESIGNLRLLQKLKLLGTNIVELPNSICNAKHLSLLDLSSTPIVELPISIGELTQLEFLSLHGCGSLRKLPESIGNLKSLRKLKLSGTNIVELPNSIGNAKHLSLLDLSGIPIVELPISIGKLTQLKFLSLHGCRSLRKLPESIGNLRSLQKLALSRTNIVELPDSINNAKHLSFLGLAGTPIVELPISIGELTQLEFLSFHGCRSLRKLPESIGNLRSLQTLALSRTKIVELPDLIKNLRKLRVIRIARTLIRRLPANIGMLERLEELPAHNCEQLASKLKIEIGNLSSLSILDLSYTCVRAVPTSINSLTRLQTLNLTDCNELHELPKLPSSLNFLYVQSTSLWLVPDLSNLTNLVELCLSNGFGRALAHASNPTQTLQLQWVGKLSKLKKLSWALSDVPVPLTELGCQSQLRELTCSCINSFDLIVVGPQFSNLKYLSKLCLYCSPLREILLDELELLRDLAVTKCEFLEGLSIISSNLRKLCVMGVFDCPKLLEIRFLSSMESLERLRVARCDSLGGFCGLSNLKNLKALWIIKCDGLRVAEGPEESELLHHLNFDTCRWLERLANVSKLRIPNECRINVRACAELPDTNGDLISYGDYREMILDRTRKTFNEEDVMETDEEESMTEMSSCYSRNSSLIIIGSPETSTELNSRSSCC